MHYRITKVFHKAGKRTEITDHLQNMDDRIKAINGLQSVHLVAVSETESIGISVYENEQQIIEAEQQFKEIMAGMMPLMTAAPEITTAAVFWKYPKD